MNHEHKCQALECLEFPNLWIHFSGTINNWTSTPNPQLAEKKLLFLKQTSSSEVPDFKPTSDFSALNIFQKWKRFIKIIKVSSLFKWNLCHFLSFFRECMIMISLITISTILKSIFSATYELNLPWKVRHVEIFQILK